MPAADRTFASFLFEYVLLVWVLTMVRERTATEFEPVVDTSGSIMMLLPMTEASTAFHVCHGAQGADGHPP